ncbi:MAG TPA: fibronectin type III domain-containing protein, partial [Deltaproteobacteria bacterium]|nr:fibronectin type III domain-containing protein [Deltaproteobacteria bacterium]
MKFRNYGIGIFIALLALVLLAGAITAADLKVNWNANTESDLAGYTVHYAAPGDPGWSMGDGQATYMLGTLPHAAAVGNVTEHTLTGVAPGPYAVALSAADASGNESELSPVVTALV